MKFSFLTPWEIFVVVLSRNSLNYISSERIFRYLCWNTREKCWKRKANHSSSLKMDLYSLSGYDFLFLQKHPVNLITMALKWWIPDHYIILFHMTKRVIKLHCWPGDLWSTFEQHLYGIKQMDVINSYSRFDRRFKEVFDHLGDARTLDRADAKISESLSNLDYQQNSFLVRKNPKEKPDQFVLSVSIETFFNHFSDPFGRYFVIF